MNIFEKVGLILAITTPVVGGSVWVGDVQSRVQSVEVRQEQSDVDHDKVVVLETQMDQLVRDVTEIKSDVKKLVNEAK